MNPLNHNNLWFSPLDLLAIEREIVREAVSEIAVSTTDGESLVALTLPVVVEQTELMGKKTLPSNRPLSGSFWANTTVSVKEREFFFRYKAVFFDQVRNISTETVSMTLLRGAVEHESILIEKAAAKIGNDPGALEMLLQIIYCLANYTCVKGSSIDIHAGIAETIIDVFAKIKEESPDILREVLYAVQNMCKGVLCSPPLLCSSQIEPKRLLVAHLIAGTKEAVTRGDWNDIMDESPFLTRCYRERFDVVPILIGLFFKNGEDRRGFYRDVSLFMNQTGLKPDEDGGFVASRLLRIKDKDKQHKICVQVGRCIENCRPHLKNDNDDNEYETMIFEILAAMCVENRVEDMEFLLPVFESLIPSLSVSEVLYIMDLLTVTQNSSYRRDLCRELLTRIPDLDVHHLPQTITEMRRDYYLKKIAQGIAHKVVMTALDG